MKLKIHKFNEVIEFDLKSVTIESEETLCCFSSEVSTHAHCFNPGSDAEHNMKLIAQAPTSLEKALAIIEIYEEALERAIPGLVTWEANNHTGYHLSNYVKEARAKAAQIVGGEG